MKEMSDLDAKMEQASTSMKELDGDFVKATPASLASGGGGSGNAEIAKKCADLEKKLQEAKAALAAERKRRETAETIKEDVAEMKKMLKKRKKKKRRSYSRSRSRSRSRSSSYSRSRS